LIFSVDFACIDVFVHSILIAPYDSTLACSFGLELFYVTIGCMYPACM